VRGIIGYLGIKQMLKRNYFFVVVITGIFLLAQAMAEDSMYSSISTEEKPHVPEIAQRPSFSANASVALFSKYVWRGQLINDESVFQPNITMGYADFSASLWGNFDLTDYHDTSRVFNEYDWTLSYAGYCPFSDIMQYSIGAIYYDFPRSANTTEIFGTLGLNISLNPIISLYRDLDEYEGTYMSFALSHSEEKLFGLDSNIPVGMTLTGSLGWGNKTYNKEYWGRLDKSAFNDLTLTAAFPIAIGTWIISPCANYVTLLDSDVRDAETYSEDDNDFFFVGLTLTKGF
jgi:hypothetical protein